MLSYRLIEGGYELLRDEQVALRQTFYPDGAPDVPIAAADREPMAQAALAAMQPVEVVSQPLTRLEFRNQFTQDEKLAIYTAAETSVEIRVWLDDLNSATEVHLDDPQTIAGVEALETAGLIDVGRAAVILEA